MGKNIVICCDGTGNHIISYPSNVLHLFTICKKSQDKQVCYYNTGLGTTPIDPDGTSQFTNVLSIAKGLAFGAGLKKDVRYAYQFLLQHYNPGDKIYLFGFSRGAYTIRVLAGYLHLYGLLEAANDHLFDYSFDLFKKKVKHKEEIFRNSGRFRKRFSRQITIHFMGIWDTVSSIGWFYDFQSFPYTNKLANIRIVRHAIALDECRVFYQPVTVTEDVYFMDQDSRKRTKQDLKELWFRGVHSDIGGSYKEEESGLAMLPLHWILSEATKEGLQVDPSLYNEFLKPKMKLIRKNILHDSTTGFFKALEFLPRFHPGLHPLSATHFRYKVKRSPPPIEKMHASATYLSADKFKHHECVEDLQSFYDPIYF